VKRRWSSQMAFGLSGVAAARAAGRVRRGSRPPRASVRAIRSVVVRPVRVRHAGDGQQAPSEGASGADGLAGHGDQVGLTQQVVGQSGDHHPGDVAITLARGKVRQCLVFEVADRELDNGVLAVLGFDDGQWLGAVGQEREVAPVGPEPGLGSEQPSAPHDQALLAERGLCDLGLALVGVIGQRLPVVIVDRGDRLANMGLPAHSDRVVPARGLQPQHDGVVPKPRVGPQQLGPSAPARRTRQMSSCTKRRAPLAVLAKPLRARTCSTSPVSARVARIG
jgi:hypothetical protein